jgi:hypothetical protein
MSSVFRKTGMSSIEQQEISSIVFVKLAEMGELDDITVSEHPGLFVEWDENWIGKSGAIVSERGKLYRSIHTITNPAQNTRPSNTPSMWVAIADPVEEYPEWSQPIGSHDAYSMDAKVSHDGKHWKSDVNNNVWQPGVYGWTEV